MSSYNNSMTDSYCIGILPGRRTSRLSAAVERREETGRCLVVFQDIAKLHNAGAGGFIPLSTAGIVGLGK